MIDTLHLCIALGPLAVYLLMIGGINLLRRPFLTTGSRDLAGLGVALSGFMVAGPMQLFIPEPALQQFGGLAWLLMVSLYALFVVLLVLLVRPRLVIYNLTAERLRPLLAAVASDLDKDARWAGECLLLPNLGVQLTVESFARAHTVQLAAAGGRQDYGGWRKLERALSRALRDCGAQRGPYAATLLASGLALTLMVIYWLAADHADVAHAFSEMLRR